MSHDDVLFGYRLQLFDLAGRTTVTEACRTFGVHRSTYYSWKAQVDRHGLEVLRPRERRRPKMPNQLSPLVEERIVAFALGHPGLGPKRIAAELARPKWGGIVVSANGVWRCLRRHGLNTRAKRLSLVAGYRAPYDLALRVGAGAPPHVAARASCDAAAPRNGQWQPPGGRHGVGCPGAGSVVVGVVLVALGADDVEALVELDVDLAAVVKRDLHLVVALLVADLRAGDLAATGVLDRGHAGPVEVDAADWSLGGVVVTAGGDGDTARDRPDSEDGRATYCELASHGHAPFLIALPLHLRGLG
jgi:transposase